jgi:steroid delta-isomerase-like uncharacterized protein
MPWRFAAFRQPAGPAVTGADPTESTRRFIELAWNQGRIDEARDLLAEDFVNHTPVNPNETCEEFLDRIAAFRRAFPDLQMTVEDMLRDGDRVVTRWSASGTHQGPFRAGYSRPAGRYTSPGSPATGSSTAGAWRAGHSWTCSACSPSWKPPGERGAGGRHTRAGHRTRAARRLSVWPEVLSVTLG